MRNFSAFLRKFILKHVKKTFRHEGEVFHKDNSKAYA